MAVTGNANKKIHPEKPRSAGGPMREKLLNEAEALFIERGFDGVSVSDIARRSKTSKGHLYYYFKNKEALFAAVLERHLSAQRVALLKAASAGGGMRERVHTALDAYVDFIEANPGFPRLIQRERRISDGMAPVHSWGEEMFSTILPRSGPASAKHFFFSIYSMTLNYYTYSAMLERLWGAAPASADALAERRAHLHEMADMIIEKYLPCERKKRR